MVPIVATWLRLELRRRWRSLVVLGLLVAVSAAVVMTALAAARRGASSITRLAARTEPATIAVLANQPGFDWTKIAALPEVRSLTKFVVDYKLSYEGLGNVNWGFPPADSAFLRTIEKPVIFAGRIPDPSRADEAIVTRKFVQTQHKGVGDTITLHLPTAKQLDASFAEDAPRNGGGLLGPTIRVRIVGVGVSPWLSDSPDVDGGIQISAGLVAKYPLETIGNVKNPGNTQFVNAQIRLGSPKDIPRFSRDLARVTGRSDLAIMNLYEQGRTIQHNIAFESRCLLAFGLAAFVAALFLVGQAIARYAAASTVELQTLRALGMTPRQAMGTAAAAPALVGLAGVVAAGAAAWLASSHFPYGTAALFEPSPGRSWDPIVIVGTAAVVAVLVAAGAAGAAFLALAAARRGTSHRRSAIAKSAARAGLPVPVVVGARFALESGRGRTAVPVRPALFGAVLGVVGIVAAFTFSSGVSDAAGKPERFGQTFQASAFAGINGHDGGPVDAVTSVMRNSALTTGISDSRNAVATGPGGRASVPLWEYRPGAKALPVVVLEGRLPRLADQVMLAPQTMAQLHAHVGGQVKLTGTRGSKSMEVTGSGLVPLGPHNDYAEGGWIASAGYNALFKGYKFRVILIRFPHGANVKQSSAALVREVVKQMPAVEGLEIDPGDVPTELALIRQVRTLPILLGAFLALLAIGAVGHALATAVRRRSRDLAVLRAVGMTQWQSRWVVITQATLLALIGLAFGVPIGLALGRTVWRVVADYTPLEYVSPISLWALLLVGPAALVVANTLAAWPGRRAARLRISHVLRAE
jgi:ABC-type lipoprotein release transport system permease subunit